MKKRTYIKIGILCVILGGLFVWNVWSSCGGALNNGRGNWTPGTNCTISNGLYSVWWDMTVAGNTITVSSNAALIMNLQSKKITFTSGRINLSGNGKIYGETTEYTWYNPDTPTGSWCGNGGRCTSCPSGKSAWNPITRWFVNGNEVYASRRWWVVCK